MTDESPWSWLRPRQAELAAKSPTEVEQAIAAAIDDDLDVEVRDEDGERQIVISANRDASRFDRVRELVAAAPSIPRWRFVALRPARGWEFEFHTDRRVDARALGFAPRKTDAGLVIRLLVPNPEWERWADIAWQIVESGIGEEAAAGIASLEVGARGDDDHVMAIESLGNYIKRHAS